MNPHAIATAVEYGSKILWLIMIIIVVAVVTSSINSMSRSFMEADLLDQIMMVMPIVVIAAAGAYIVSKWSQSGSSRRSRYDDQYEQDEYEE